MSNKKITSVALAAGLTVGGAAGLLWGVPALAGAQSTTTTAPATEDTSGSGGSGGTTDDAKPERGQWLEDALAPLVEDGTITQAQADAVIAALEAAKPDRPFDGPGMGGHFGRGPGLDAAAEALGITTDELFQALRDGQTIAEVAADQGVEVQTVVDAMLADLKAHLDEEVASGEHTQAEADEKLANAEEIITAMVNGEIPEGGPMGPGHGGPWGRGGDGSGTDDSGES